MALSSLAAVALAEALEVARALAGSNKERRRWEFLAFQAHQAASGALRGGQSCKMLEELLLAGRAGSAGCLQKRLIGFGRKDLAARVCKIARARRVEAHPDVGLEDEVRKVVCEEGMDFNTDCVRVCALEGAADEGAGPEFFDLAKDDECSTASEKAVEGFLELETKVHEEKMDLEVKSEISKTEVDATREEKEVDGCIAEKKAEERLVAVAAKEVEEERLAAVAADKAKEPELDALLAIILRDLG